MIDYVVGKLISKNPTHVVIETNGIGYHINISLNTYSSIGNEEFCKLFTHFQVKEDAHTLYGFQNIEEREIFQLLISISGVGPSTGIMVLSSLTPLEIQKAIVHEDLVTIQNIKGIGSKTAQRIVLELKDKMMKLGLVEEGDQKFAKIDNTLRNEALSALVTLGINRGAAEKSIDFILKNSGDNITLEELIKRALKTS